MQQNTAQTITIDAATLAQLMLVSSQLFGLLQQVQKQSAANAPEVWAAVSADYKAAMSLWGAVQPA